MPNLLLPVNFNPNDYGLTVFKPDMVLTAEQLNTLFGFLTDQDQRSRRHLIGVGVVCGLTVKRNSNQSISLSRGCGITSEGDLLNVEADLTLDSFAPYALADHPAYPPFQAIGRLKLWELFPAVHQSPATVRPLASALPTEFRLENMVVLLYLETELKAADNCTGVACDNKGDSLANRLRILLVAKPDAEKLIEPAHVQAAAACSQLVPLRARRARLDDLPYDLSLKRFQTFINHAINDLMLELERAYNLMSNVLTPFYGGSSPMPSWRAALRQVASTALTDGRIQYVYGWLKDLYEAYNEFRAATYHWLVVCLPDRAWFPRHLLLGELDKAPSDCQPRWRHSLLRSPAVAPEADARQHAGWLHQRIGKMIELFAVPPAKTEAVFRGSAALAIGLSMIGGPKMVSRTKNPSARGRTAATSQNIFVVPTLKITLDQMRVAAFDQRAIPFYYQPAMRQFWSYPHTKHYQQAQIQSYHLPGPPVTDAVARPFSYGSEGFDFYRIEGFLNQRTGAVLQQVLELRRDHQLAFEVIAVRADAQQRLITQDLGLDFEDLQLDFDDLINQIQGHEKELTPIPKLIPTPRRGSPRLQVTLPMPTTVFAKALTDYRGSLVPFNKQVPAQFILGTLPLLQRLNTSYQRRQTSLAEQLTFGTFLRQHPGLEHGAGVPRGGTFVLVYKNGAVKGQERISVTVADFYLPYSYASRGNNLSFVLPSPPPTIALAKRTFCLGEKDIFPIQVDPPGGQVVASKPELVGLLAGQFVFKPIAVGTFTLTYTAPNGQIATTQVDVLPLPKAGFGITKNAQGLAQFTLSTDSQAKEVSWDFGDRTPPQAIKIDAQTNGNTTHQYKLAANGSGKFLVKLTVGNGACSQSSSQDLVFVTTAPPLPKLRMEPDSPFVCFNPDKPVKMVAEPEGGKFSIKSPLKIGEKTGAFVPNLPGVHPISYELNGAKADLVIFITPSTLDATARRVGREMVVQAAVIAPPPTVLMVWRVNEQIELKVDKITAKDALSVITFLPVPVLSSFTLTLQLLENTGKPICIDQKLAKQIQLPG